MTPLAHFHAKRLTLPVKKRSPFKGEEDVAWRALFEGVHCFEVTEILDVMVDFRNTLVQEARKRGHDAVQTIMSDLMFLPAEKTWIEFKSRATWQKTSNRLAFFLVQNNTGAEVFMVGQSGVQRVAQISLSNFMNFRFMCDVHHGADTSDLILQVYCFLALINTPRIIGRRQFMPNRALERRLAQHFGPGKFPLHAWTEIKLEISKPVEIDDGEPHEAHLTGRRALHFCRAHLRLKNGRVEYVRSHWRGDPAIGIRQSRYVVQR